MFGSSERVLQLLAERERLDAALLAEVGGWAASGEYAADGAATPTSWLVHHGKVSSVEAVRLLRSGRLVHSHERTAKLLDAGDVSTSHVDVLARAARHREACFDEHEETLLDAARALPVERFRLVARRWRLLADDVAADADATDMYDRRRLSCSTTFHGQVRIDGLLDPEGGAIVVRALEALMDPDSKEPAWRRRADALVALAGGRRAKVHLDVIGDPDTLAGRLPTDLEQARNDLTGIGPVARSTLRRLACDATIGRILRRGRSEILDVGRAQRLVTRAQRRALDHRDQGCVFPGCDRPKEWCDAHHLVHWIDGGTTDLDNLALLCRHHHTLTHEGGWTLTRHPDGTIDARAP